MIFASFTLAVAFGCHKAQPAPVLEQFGPQMELKARLETANFELITSQVDAVETSWKNLDNGKDIPETWPVQFAGTNIAIPRLNPTKAFGIVHDSLRISSVYPFDNVRLPKYGELIPLAFAHYLIPNGNLSLKLLLVVFQSDPSGSLSGIGVRSLDTSGFETSAPFSIGLKAGELNGLFFYDDFLKSDEKVAVAARVGWDRGFLLIDRFEGDIVLSSYLPWN